MRVLIACEESQRVCIAFRKRGHEVYDRQKNRAKTFEGVAEAMAEQWGKEG